MSILFTPTTAIRLYSGVPLSSKYEDTIDFASKDDQLEWLEPYRTYSTSDFTYQRENGVVRVKWEYDKVVNVNYIAYKNSNFTEKWFFAFVTKVEYKNPMDTWLYLEQDVLQTWMFDYSWLPSFIERETVADDRPFKHTIPEGLEKGPYIISAEGRYDYSLMAIVVAITRSTFNSEIGQIKDGIFTGVKYLYYLPTDDGLAKLTKLIDDVANVGQLDTILAIFCVPAAMIVYDDSYFEIKVEKNISGVKNKKLLCYPYRYLTLSNEQGVESEFRYELFDNPWDFIFSVRHSVNLASTAQCNAMNYAVNNNGPKENWNSGVVLNNFPQCTWSGNIYSNWLAQNSQALNNQIKDIYLQLAAGAIQMLTTLNPSGIVGSVNNAYNLMGSIEDMASHPYQVQQKAACNLGNVKWNRVGFTVRQYQITSEYRTMIDNYFSIYGYRVNRVGLPETQSRTNWNYIKTADAKITGKFPEEHIRKIKEIYNKGLTIWHNNYGDYNRDNPTVINWAEIQYPVPSIPDEIEPPVPDSGGGNTPDPQPGELDIPSGGWSGPMDGWENHVSSEWGWRADPFTGEQKFHNGIDIAYAQGTPIYAPHSGTVRLNSYNEIRGNYIEVQVSDGCFYRLQHMQAPSLFQQGNEVTGGVYIGNVGSSGEVTGPHLHLEIWGRNVENDTDYESVNPRLYLPVG